MLKKISRWLFRQCVCMLHVHVYVCVLLLLQEVLHLHLSLERAAQLEEMGEWPSSKKSGKAAVAVLASDLQALQINQQSVVGTLCVDGSLRKWETKFAVLCGWVFEPTWMQRTWYGQTSDMDGCPGAWMDWGIELRPWKSEQGWVITKLVMRQWSHAQVHPSSKNQAGLGWN